MRALILWALAGVLLLGWIGQIPQNRTQEARVLETAREMLNTGWRGWMVPHLNGRVRLEKPPLTYWLAAGSFKIFGVSTWAGRLPMALFAWLTIALTYMIGRRLFNGRAGLFGAGALLSCYLFYRYGRLAETDVLAAFFVTAAIYCIWRGASGAGALTGTALSIPSPGTPGEGRVRARPTEASAHLECRAVLWYHLSAIATTLAILSKGPPGAFPILFLLAFAAIERRWRILRDYLASGAWVTLALIALPWFIYVRRLPEWPIVQAELRLLVSGEDHGKPPWDYLVMLPKAMLPWIGFLPAALIGAVRLWNKDRRLRGLLVWTLVIFIPLSLVPQKQEHYLLPLMPPLMLMLGWLMDQAIDTQDRVFKRAAILALGATTTVALLAAIGPLAGARTVRGQIIGLDVHVALLIAFLMLAVTFAFRFKGLQSAFVMLVGSAVLLMALVLSIWVPSLQPVRYEQVATAIRESAPDRPLAFYKEENVPLIWHLRQVVPACRTDAELEAALASNPRLVVITEWESKKPKPVPPGLIECGKLRMEDRFFGLYCK